MSGIDADRLAEQVRLAYEFVDALHGQGIALIKDVETQLMQATEELQCLRPRGYRFVTNELSLSLERPQPTIADSYAVFFRHFDGAVKTTPLGGQVPPIGFTKVVFRERGLEHPETRYGILTEFFKPEGREGSWPKKVEEIANHIARRALSDPAWFGREVSESYEDSYVGFHIRGAGVRLADLPDSEAIAEMIVDPLLLMYREAIEQV